MQTAGSGPDSPSTATFLMLLVTASGHPGNVGYDLAQWRRRSDMGDDR